MSISAVYSEPSQISKMKHFAKIVDMFAIITENN